MLIYNNPGNKTSRGLPRGYRLVGYGLTISLFAFPALSSDFEMDHDRLLHTV